MAVRVKSSGAASAEREPDYRSFFENALEGMFQASPDGRFLSANPAMASLLGYASAQELLARVVRFDDLWVDPAAHEALRRRLDEAGRVEGSEAMVRRRDGSAAWVAFSIRAVGETASGSRRHEGIAIDVSERHRAADALRALVAGTSTSVGVEFFRGLVRHMAAAFGARYALVGELLPDRHRVRTLAAWAGDAQLEPFEYALADTPCANVVAGGPCVYHDDVQQLFPRDRLLADMGVRSYCGIPLRASSGEPLGILAVLDDARMAGPDEQLRGLLRVFAARASAEVERLHAERALRQSELQRRELQSRAERLSAMRALVAGVAHEVRNSLFGITANLDTIQAELGSGRPNPQSFAVVNEAVGRLGRLMAQMLDFGGAAAITLAAGRLEDVVRLAAEAFEPMAREKAVSLVVEVEPGLPPVDMERPRLAQAVRNLLQNSVQHSAAGGCVRLAVRRANDDGSRCVECLVDDDGTGFEPADLPRLFEPFFTRRRGATGLGLSIVQKIVEEHGGTVTAENRPSGGARLRVRLPPSSGPVPVGTSW